MLVGYPRVSTRVQVKNGASIPYQDREIRAWARGNGHRIVGMFPEEGRSGALDLEDRAALTTAIDLRRCASAITAVGLRCHALIGNCSPYCSHRRRVRSRSTWVP